MALEGKNEKIGERAQNANQSGSDRGHGRRFRDDEPGPGVEKAAQRTVGVADINIFSARLRLHGAKFGIGERAKKRKQPAHQPRQIHQLRRAHGLHHLGGNQKNSAADDRPHNHGRGVADAQVAGQLGTGGGSLESVQAW